MEAIKECDTLSLFVVGLDIMDIINLIMDRLKVNPVNPVKEGRLGNFRTVNCAFDIPKEDVITFRRELVAELNKETGLQVMYSAKDWMHIYVFPAIAFKTRYIMKNL